MPWHAPSLPAPRSAMATSQRGLATAASHAMSGRRWDRTRSRSSSPATGCSLPAASLADLPLPVEPQPSCACSRSKGRRSARPPTLLRNPSVACAARTPLTGAHNSAVSSRQSQISDQCDCRDQAHHRRQAAQGKAHRAARYTDAAAKKRACVDDAGARASAGRGQGCQSEPWRRRVWQGQPHADGEQPDDQRHPHLKRDHNGNHHAGDSDHSMLRLSARRGPKRRTRLGAENAKISSPPLIGSSDRPAPTGVSDRPFDSGRPDCRTAAAPECRTSQSSPGRRHARKRPL